MRLSAGRPLVIRRRKPPLELWTVRENVYLSEDFVFGSVETGEVFPVICDGSTVSSDMLNRLGLVPVPVCA